MTLELYQYILEKYHSIKFHEILSSGRRAVPCEKMVGEMDMTKLTVAFSQLYEHA